MATELKRAETTLDRIEELLGANARTLLDHKSQTIAKEALHLPGPDFIDRVWSHSDRSPAVLRSLQTLLSHGDLAGRSGDRTFGRSFLCSEPGIF